MRRDLFAGSAVGLALLALPMLAGAQTVIQPDVGARGLGTTATVAGHVTTIDGGTLSGANLFHSFSTFSLGAGDTARWTRAGGDAAAVHNVVSRVTGGQPSQIAGAIDSTDLPNAAFYFINPAGIVFGAGAQVNVPAAAYFSTASQLKFADGTTFSATTPSGSTLSMAAPASFGFVGGEGDVAIQGVGHDFATPAETITLVGANVSVTGSQFVARGLDIAAAGAGTADVALADPLAAPLAGEASVQGSQIAITTQSGLSGALRLGGGGVTVDGSTLASDSGNAVASGDIVLSAGRLVLTNGAQLGVATRGDGAGGALTLKAGDLEAQSGLLYTVATGVGAAGPLSLSADTITLGAGLTLSSTSSGSGPAGAVSLTARTSMAATSALVTDVALGAGAGGDITISAPQIDLVETLVVTTGNSSGKPGDLRLAGDRIAVSGGVLGSSPGATTDTGDLNITATTSFDGDGVIMTASTYSDGAAGVIAISAPQITLKGGFIDTNSYGAGGVGRVSILGQTLSLTDVSITSEAQGQFTDQVGVIQLKGSSSVSLSGGFVTSNARGSARGGTISVEGGKVQIDNPRITADSFGSGAGGQISIRGSAIHVSNGAISSDAVIDGPAGDVTLQAPSIVIDQSAKISSNALDLGDAGTVTLAGGAIQVLDGAMVTSQATAGKGNAGNVVVTGDSLLLQDASISSDTQAAGRAGGVNIKVGSLEVDGLRRPLTFISSDTLGQGDAGNVIIQADKIVLHDQGYISSDSFTDAHAGQVTVKAGSLTVRDSSHISSVANGFGHAGDVSVTADSLLIQGDPSSDTGTYIATSSVGGGDAGRVQVAAKTLKVDQGGFIASDTGSPGDAGEVDVTATTLTLDNASGISSSTLAEGHAGNVLVTAGTATLDHGAAILSVATAGSTGEAGSVSLTADTVNLLGNARISTSTAGGGSAGVVALKAGALNLDSGDVSSAALPGATGGSGALAIAADSITLTNGGTISTISNNPQRAGQIDVAAGTISVAGTGSFIASENQAGNVALGNAPGEVGDAGSIHLSASRVTVADGGRVSTNSYAGAAGEIGIAIQRPGLLVLKGAVAPGVIQTSSGPGTGGRIVISDPLAIISNGGSLLALGQLHGANVLIQSRYFIDSADRVNTVAVDGDILLETGLYDVSSGTVTRELSVLDASKVLRGQCPTTRSTGVVSQLVSRPVGPYVREPAPGEAPVATAVTRGCR